jgi:hypothetical protein
MATPDPKLLVKIHDAVVSTRQRHTPCAPRSGLSGSALMDLLLSGYTDLLQSIEYRKYIFWGGV